MRIRTADPLLAKQMLYQLSYAPNKRKFLQFASLQTVEGKTISSQEVKVNSCATRYYIFVNQNAL